MGISRINNNINAQAQNALNNLIATNLQRSTERLSSGLRINRAGDDAAGLSIANRLQAQISGIGEAINGAQSGINFANVADQGLSSISDRLLRIRELTVQAGNTGVLDSSALQSIQAEIAQNVDEIGRIANTTQFGSNQLLNGDFATTAGIRSGTGIQGIQVDDSDLTSRENFLNIEQVQNGAAQIFAGDATGSPQVVNAGIQNTQDIAVTEGTFFNSNAGAASAAGDTLTDTTFNGVTLQNGGTITFRGTLADGVTEFSGTFNLSGATDIAGGGGANTSLADAIQAAIDQTEADQGIDTAGGTNAGETNVAFNAATGRLEFQNGATEGVSQFNLELTVQNAAGQNQNVSGTTRAEQIGGVASGAQTGNSVTAITGSTFEDGQITLEVSDVVAAQQQQVRSTIAFEGAGGGAATAATNLVGAVFNGSTLAAGDTIALNGTNADGTTFTSTITISNVDLGAGSGDATTLQDLLDELNTRDRTLTAGGAGNQSGFEDATAGLDANGRIELTDNVAQTSQTGFTLTVNDNTPASGGTFGTISDNAELVQAGTEEQATISLNGGAGQRVTAGDVVTLQGDGGQITLRAGTGLTNGTDTINATRDEFVGRLNNGPGVRFGAGDQNVRFVSGLNRNGETATLDFDAIIGVPGLDSNNFGTVILSATGQQANFQIGPNAQQGIGLSFGDVRPQALGLGEGRTLNDINVTEPGGVGESLQIIDEALSQVNDFRGDVGAVTNRLESTVNSLSVTSENLLSSQSRIQDANYAEEATRQAINQLLLNFNLGVQAQTSSIQNAYFLDFLR